MTRVTRKIKDVISEVKSGDWGKDSPTENYTTDVLCVRGADIPELCKGNVGKMPQRFIHNKKATSKILSANNLIIEISGGSPTQSTGRIALISDKILSRYSKPLICSNFCKAITATGIQPEYLFNYWLYLYNKDAMFSYENGTTGIKNLDFNSFIQEQDISIPDIKTQQKIVSILSSIDEKIETNKRINDNLEEQTKALFKSWFVDNQDNDWKKIRLEEILEIGKTSIIPAQSPDTIFEHYSLPAFDNGTRPAYEKGSAIKSSKFYIQKNMFLFSKLNPRIKRIWFPNIQTEKAICSTEFIPYKPKDASLLGFCYSIVNSEAFYEYVLSLTNGSTGSHQRFHPTATLDYSLKIPDKDIIKKFESIVRPLYELIAKNRTENERLASLRDTLLPKLMSGEIFVEEVSLD